jgi:chaperonin GroES
VNFRPLHDQVMVTRVEAEEKTASGIIIPDSTKEKPQQAKWPPLGQAGATRPGS